MRGILTRSILFVFSWVFLSMQGGSSEAFVVKHSAWTMKQPYFFYTYLPNDNHWKWFLDSVASWNALVTSNPNPGFKDNEDLFGYYLTGPAPSGKPIRDHLPGPKNGLSEVAVLTAKQIKDLGLSGHKDLTDLLGLTIRWSTGEADVIVNDDVLYPSQELSFRVAMTHELGHVIGLGHENHQYAIMAASEGQVRHYLSKWYNHLDDVEGARSLLQSTNSKFPGAWVLDKWADMCLWSQSADGVARLFPDPLIHSSLKAGQTVTMEYLQVENRGLLDAANVHISVSLQAVSEVPFTDEVIALPEAYEIYHGYWDDFCGKCAWKNGSITTTLPSDIPSGKYYVVLRLTTDTPQKYDANDMTVLFDTMTEPVIVTLENKPDPMEIKFRFPPRFLPKIRPEIFAPVPNPTFCPSCPVIPPTTDSAALCPEGLAPPSLITSSGP